MERKSSNFIWWLGLLIFCFLLMLVSLERKGWVASFSGSLAVFGVIMLQTRGAGAAIKHRLFFGLAIAIPVILATFPLLLQIDSFNVQLMKLFSSASSISSIDIVIYSTELVYESNLVRAFLLDEAFKAFLAHPVFGLGAGGLQIYIWSHYPNNPNITGAHNEYMAMAVEQGAIGLLLYVSTWLFLLREAIMFSLLRSNHITFHDRLIYVGIVVYGMVVCLFLAASAMTVFYMVFPIAIGLALRQRIMLGMQADAFNQRQEQARPATAI